DGFPSPDKFVPSPEHTSLFSSRDGTSRAKHRSRLLAQCARVADILGPETETHKQGTFPASLTEMRLPDTSSGANAWGPLPARPEAANNPETPIHEEAPHQRQNAQAAPNALRDRRA